MAEYTGNFETGVHGNTIQAADAGSLTQWDDRSFGAPDSTLTYSNVQKYGSLSGEIVLSATPQPAYVSWDSSTLGTAITTIYGRIYLYYSGLPNTSTFPVRGFDTGARAWEILIGSTGLITVRDNAGTGRGTGAVSISTAQWIRLEVKAVSSTTAGVIECKLFNDSDSATPTETITSTGSFSTLSRTDQVRFGEMQTNNASRTVYMDNILVNDTGYPGPAGGGGPTLRVNRGAMTW